MFASVPYTQSVSRERNFLPETRELVSVDNLRQDLFTVNTVLPKAVSIFSDNDNFVLSVPTGDRISTPEIQMLVERWSKFISLSDVCKDLLSMLYPNLETFVRSKAHPLEDYVISYDDLMGDEASVRALGYRLGIHVPLDIEFQADDIFISKFMDVLEIFAGINTDMPIIPGTSNVISIETMININIPEFKKFLDEINIPFDEVLYQDRLYLLANLVRQDFY